MRYYETSEYRADARALRASLRPLIDAMLADLGITRDELHRAMAGDRTSPAWAIVSKEANDDRAA